MSFVVKKECYLDEHGNGRPSSIHAKKHDDYEMAEVVALTCGGKVVELMIRQIEKWFVQKLNRKRKKHPKQIKLGCERND